MTAVSRFFDRQKNDSPDTEIGIGGFTAFVRVRERSEYRANLPTSVVEDGSFLNDHILLQPVRLRIEGNVSDVHVRRSQLQERYQRALSETGNITQFAPDRTQAQVSKAAALVNDATDAVRRANSYLEAGVQAINYFGNQDTSAKPIREQFIDEMEAIYFGRQLIAIDMFEPFRQFTGMVITSLVIDGDNETDSVDFTIEAQQIRLAELQYTAIRAAAGTGGQTERASDKGAQEGEPVPRSFLNYMLGG